jgi:hypothetical protein
MNNRLKYSRESVAKGINKMNGLSDFSSVSSTSFFLVKGGLLTTISPKCVFWKKSIGS